MKAAGLYILAVLVASVALAGGEGGTERPCPPCDSPPRLTCDQLRARLVSRKCGQPDCKPAPWKAEMCLAVPCTAVDCKAVDCEPVPCVPPPAIPQGDDPKSGGSTPTPTGHWFAGGGPIYSAGWGAAGAVGYKWPSGWMLMGGPNWIPRDSSNGTVTNCAGNSYPDLHGGSHGGGGCVTLPYSVQSPSPWGAQLLVLIPF